MNYLKSISDEQIEQLYKSAFSGLIGHSILITLVTIMLIINSISVISSVFIWTLAQFIIILFRATSTKLYFERESNNNNIYWLLINTFGGFLTGLAWGLVILVFNKSSSTELEFLIVATVIGLAASAIATLGSVFISYVSFAVPMMLINAIWMLSQVGNIYKITAAMMVFAVLYLLSAAYKYNQFFRKTISQYAELKAGSLDIIKHLSMAGEYRDTDTANHVIRMSKYCQLLAIESGYDEDFGETILYASPMHDVGKIGIPDRILLKPGKLTEEEFEIMKSHTIIGSSILTSQRSEIIKMAKIIARSHHEKYDGSGYPYGLKAEEIPIEGRIAAICDVFDALTSKRPYKHAWQIEEAVRHIKEQSGKHFDPVLSKTFISILPEILELKEKYKDGSGQKLTAFR